MQTSLPLYDYNKLNSKKEKQIIGRENEMDAIIKHFDQILEGKFAACVIRGEAGVGKTFFVSHVAKRLINLNATYVQGKFKHYNNAMFSGIAEILNQLVEQTLTFSDERLETVKKLLIKELGKDSHLIITICPEVEKLLGYYKKIDDDDYHKLESKFLRAISIFMDILSQELYPLIVHVDDLQWADLGSLRMINYLYHQKNDLNFYLVLSSRSEIENLSIKNELSRIFESEEKNRVSIILKRLDFNETRAVIDQSFNNKVCELEIVSTYIYKATMGTPFYIDRLIDSLIKEKKVHYNINENIWKIDVEFLKQLQLPADIQKILSTQVSKLSEKDQNLLMLLACMGGQADKRMINKIIEIDLITTYHQLEKLCNMGILTKNQHQNDDLTQYLFSHDIIFEMMHSLMDDRYRVSTHYHVANQLINNNDKVYVDEQRVFIALQLLECISLINLEKDTSKYVLELYYAGIRAKQATQVEESLLFFEQSISLMPKADASIIKELYVTVRIEYAECLFICGFIEKSESEFVKLINDYKEDSDQVRIKRKLVLLYNHLGLYNKVIDLSLEILVHLDFELKIDYTQLRLGKEILIGNIKFTNQYIDKIMRIPESNNERIFLIEDTLIRMASVANLVDEELFALVLTKLCNLSIKYGSSKYTAPSYASFSYILMHYLNNPKKAYKIIEKVKELANKSEDEDMLCMTYFIIGTFMEHWYSNPEKSIDYLKRAVDLGIKSSEYQYACFAFSSMIDMKYAKGNQLEEVLESIQQLNAHDNRLKEQEIVQITIKILQDHISKLQGNKIEQLTEQNIKNLDDSQKLTYYNYKLQRMYLMDNLQSCDELIDYIRPLIGLFKGYILYADCLFYVTLVRLEKYSQSKEKVKDKRQIKKALGEFKKWNDLSEEANRARYLLLKAKYEEVFKKSKDSGTMYEEAIRFAKENHQMQLESIGYLLASKYYYKNETIANIYMDSAIKSLTDWGALHCVKVIKDKYGLALSEDDEKNDYKVSKVAISQEIRKNKAISISKMPYHLKQIEDMNENQTFQYILGEIVKENGANYGAIYLESNDQMYLSYEYINDEIKEFKEPIHMEDVHTIPHKVMRYVVRTGSQVTLNKKPESGIFVNDSYYREKEKISLACLPLKYMGVSCGIAYLDWNVEDGFSSDIIESIQAYVPVLMAKTMKQSVPIKKVVKINSELTERESEVLLLITKGLTNKQIGDNLCISLSTVKTHIINIYSKLEIKNRVEAVEKAREIGIIG